MALCKVQFMRNHQTRRLPFHLSHGFASFLPNGQRQTTPSPVKHEGLLLNVGSSTQVLEGFENLDNSPWLLLTGSAAAPIRALLPDRYRSVVTGFQEAALTASMRRHDCRKPLPYADGSVDHILCSHFLEHLSQEEMRSSLADFFRVLKPG